MILHADARALPLRDASEQCCVTSPPYWGLRDYGCPQQIGLEPTPDAYVAALVTVFRDVHRVLKDDGTVWINLGDSYASGGRKTRDPGQSKIHPAFVGESYRDGLRPDDPVGIKPKDLLGIPWRVAFALQADGWYLRSDIIWSKPNPMPESVTDRPTKSHEYLFLLAKQERYYYDATAIREPYAESTLREAEFGYRGTATKEYAAAGVQDPSETKRRVVETVRRRVGMVDGVVNGAGRNRRSVWTVPTMPYSGAHFATFPEALVEPCILAGCTLGGLVLDPFIGSGTVGAVAERLSRRWVGVDLSYQDLAKTRTAQRGLRFAGDVA